MTTENEANQDEESEFPTNLFELFQHFLNVDSPYHHLGLLSLRAIIWNLDIYVYLLKLLNFQEKLLEFQKYGEYVKDDELEPKAGFIVDECSLLRHSIILSCYHARHKRNEAQLTAPEEVRLFSSLPPPEELDDGFVTRSSSETELASWLQESGPGLRDSGWISQTRKAHKSSTAPMKTTVLLDLLVQMEQAIETVEWVDHLKWNSNLEFKDDYWHPEEKRAIEFIVHYGVMNGQLEKSEQYRIKKDLKVFIKLSHDFINYNKSLHFDGFDWFLATIFLICNGELEKSKIFIYRLLRFPSTMFMWPALAQVIDESNEEEASTRLLFAHLLESIISQEFPTIKFALKRECGIDWWMICDRLHTQSFLGILPWSEIVHYFAICIMHPPDYVLYYSASLLNHCEGNIMEIVMKGKMWPEEMVFEDYRCHSQIGFMDRLGKRHGGKVLPPLTQRKLNVPDNIDSLN